MVRRVAVGAPVVGTRFTFQTKPAGRWDGTIVCEVLEVEENARLSYSWSGGHEDNDGYGSRLDTIVSITLAPVDNGTRVRLVHSGFVLPQNGLAYRNMGEGWKHVTQRLGAVIADEVDARAIH